MSSSSNRPVYGAAVQTRGKLSVAVVMGGFLAQQVLTFLTGIVVARYIGSSGYGVTSVVRNIVTTLVALTPLGLDLALLKHLPQMQDKPARYYALLTRFRLITFALTLLFLVFAFAGGAVFLEQHVYKIAYFSNYLIIGLAGLPFATDLAVMNAHYKVQNKPAKFSLIYIYTSSIFRVFAIYFVLLSGWSVLGVVIVNSAAYAVSSAFMFLEMRLTASRSPAPASEASDGESLSKTIANIFNESIWMALGLFSVNAFRSVDLLVLAAFRPASESGSYSAMSVVAQIVQVYPLSIAQTLGPTISRCYHANDLKGVKDALDGYIRKASLMGSFVFGGIASFGNRLDFIFGKSFHFLPSIAILIPLGWLISATLGPIGFALSMTGRHKQELFIIVVGGAGLLGLCFLLIPPFGQVGAGASVIVAFICMNVARFSYVSKVLGFIPGALKDLLPPIAALAIGSSVEFLTELALGRGLLVLILGCALYSLGFALCVWTFFMTALERGWLESKILATLNRRAS